MLRPVSDRPSMQMKLPIRIVAVASLAALCVQASAATPPQIAAKQAQAKRVLAQISAIDQQVNTISEQYDGAHVRLSALHARLLTEGVALTRAKIAYQRAEQRAANLLVYLYTSSHASTLDVILGATSLSQLLSLSDDENAITRQAAVIASQTDTARDQVRATVSALEFDRASAQTTLTELATRRSEIEHRLGERQRLLRGVEAQVSRLQAQERALQERLAAEARARLAAEAAARARAEAAAAALAHAQALARAKALAQAKALAHAQALAQARALARQQAAARLAAAEAAKKAAAALRASATTTLTTATVTTPTQTTATQTGTLPDSDSQTLSVPSTTVAVSTPTTTLATPGSGTTNLPPVATTTLPATTTTPVVSEPLPAGYPQAATIVLQYIGIPYKWAGDSTAGFDCSGLVSYVYAQLGITLPHFAAAQYTYGVPVLRSQLQPGDLVFFDALGHVGIYIGDNEFVDAPHTGTFVRIDMLTDPWYSSHYVGARRL